MIQSAVLLKVVTAGHAWLETRASRPFVGCDPRKCFRDDTDIDDRLPEPTLHCELTSAGCQSMPV